MIQVRVLKWEMVLGSLGGLVWSEAALKEEAGGQGERRHGEGSVGPRG